MVVGEDIRTKLINTLENRAHITMADICVEKEFKKWVLSIIMSAVDEIVFWNTAVKVTREIQSAMPD
jgi:hypothetical protein